MESDDEFIASADKAIRLNITECHNSLEYGWQYLTMLFSPCANIHLYSGIIPPRVISLPADCYEEDLNNLEIKFAINHMLELKGDEAYLPLPVQQDYEVTWNTKSNSNKYDANDFDSLRLFQGQTTIQDGWFDMVRLKER